MYTYWAIFLINKEFLQQILFSETMINFFNGFLVSTFIY